MQSHPRPAAPVPRRRRLPDTAALVEEHLKDCEACQEGFHKLQEAVDLALPSPEREEQKTESLKK